MLATFNSNKLLLASHELLERFFGKSFATLGFQILDSKNSHLNMPADLEGLR